MKNIKLILSAALFASLVGCVNSDNYNAPDLTGECTDLTATKTIQDVAALATNTTQQWNSTTDSIIEAFVTSSDEGGNFYKSISLVSIDGAKGFSMPVDAYNLYTKYEPGRKVFVNLNRRHFANNSQTYSLEVGSLYNGTQVGRVSGVEYENVITRSCTKVDESTIVNNMTIAAAKNNANLNKLIEFDAVQFSDESLGKKFYDPTLNSIGGATNHVLKDAAGNSIIVRVSEFATFASKSIPSGNGKVRGVLTRYNSDYQFMVRTENDVMLTNPRVVPLFEESFTSNFGLWTKQSVVGAQVWATNTFGNPGLCAAMSGFASSTNNANEDWLISPAINLASVTSATLTFDNASRFAGNLIEVYVSTNYTSGAPSTATWTALTGYTLDTNTGSYVWTASGPINISSYSGNSNFRVAFKYTSTTTASRTWEIDNVKVVGQ
ncbi:DUF5689 domain-containing protein [Flavobacterium urocaniciphilum]|uniref:DUF5689 domain-containing protein n=1 Tax=Flavobacterium urocaniciphilum TaxID=1299341 RepID=A0A1H9E381_9FLAO|nr:DUF5689 domain-containing protein [Flavobacterium urocaniciphilum]SEQ20087.1 hypothetical protein SAMN05444005_10965 [Flavobacterium urocaniciphilum]